MLFRDSCPDQTITGDGRRICPIRFSSIGLSMFEGGIAAIFPKDLRIDHAFQIFALDGGIEAIALRVSITQSVQSASSR